MNFEKAIKLLDIKGSFTERELKKAYFKQALKYHPDKNKDENTKVRFQDIGEAYGFLLKNGKDYKDYTKLSFRQMLEKCLQMIQVESDWETLFVQTTLHSLLLDYKNISIKVFETMRKERALEVYEFFVKYGDIFSISEDWLLKMRNIIKKKMEGDNIIILNPNLEDMLNDKIYKLELEDRTYYIPLWHNELCYDASGNDIIIRCIPELDINLTIDNDNNMYYIAHETITNVLNNKKMVVTMGNKVFEIPSSELKIIARQIYTLYEKGILYINTENIYDNEKRGHIYIDIHLN